MAYVYANLVNPVNTGSGVAEFLLLAPVTAFTDDGIKCPAAPFTNPGDEVTVKQAHVFKAGEGFIKVQLAPEKNKLDAATIGDRGFSKLDITLDVFIPGSYAIVHEAVKNWVNKPLIAMIKDAECTANMFYQLGCDCASAWLTVDFSTGTSKDGVKGYNGKLSYQNGYIQVYMGPAPTIKGAAASPVVTPPVVTYTKTLTFSAGRINNDAQSGISAVIAAGTSQADLDLITIEYDEITANTTPPLSGLSVRMDMLKSVSPRVEFGSLTTLDVYAGKNFRIKTPDGVKHTVVFANTDVPL